MRSGSMIASRSHALLRRVIPHSLQRAAAFSTAGLSASHRGSNFFDSGDFKGDSAVYRHSLLFQQPAVVKSQQPLRNSVKFIGTVMLHPRTFRANGPQIGAFTVLNVETPAHSCREFRILLVMWGDLAHISLAHLKPNDFIYVSGLLGSYEKVDADGSPRLCYKVVVKELNYVSPCARGQPKSVKSEPHGGLYGLGRKEQRLHLWHIYFASPLEWWDNRKSKKYLREPDFKHKDTGEALWLNSDDPPWLRKQLQLLDSRMLAGAGPHLARKGVRPWVYDG